MFFFATDMIFCKNRNKTNEIRKPNERVQLNPLQKTLLVTGGVVSLALGLIGIPVPLLPTTPFLLLSAFLFARSSPRLYNWLINHRYLGKYIREYREKHGVPLKVKIGSITLLWASILYSAFWVFDLLWLSILLIAIALGVTFHILCMKTLK